VSKRIAGSTGKTKARKRVTGQPASAAPSSRYLVWRFGRLDYGTTFNCQKLLRTDVQGLESELASFQRVTIAALERKRWLKFIPAEQMTPEGRRALAEVNPQEEGLWQLHLLRYRWRVWGYFENPEFFFLWWDGDHAVATGKWRKRKS
jgi:hypothetical protein